jgi:hypothetical protein
MADNAVGGHPEFLKILDQMRELHIRKAADYGRGADPFANVRASAEFGIPEWVGVMVRANDKVHRIKSFIANGTLKNESVEDSLKDLAAYAIIALVLYREMAAWEQVGMPTVAGPRLPECVKQEPDWQFSERCCCQGCQEYRALNGIPRLQQ